MDIFEDKNKQYCKRLPKFGRNIVLQIKPRATMFVVRFANLSLARYLTNPRVIAWLPALKGPLEPRLLTEILLFWASFSPVPELSFLPAPYRGWTRAGERRVQDNLHTHAQNEPIKNYQVPTTLLASMCRSMPFSARALKENIFFDVDIDIKNIKT